MDTFVIALPPRQTANERADKTSDSILVASYSVSLFPILPLSNSYSWDSYENYHSHGALSLLENFNNFLSFVLEVLNILPYHPHDIACLILEVYFHVLQEYNDKYSPFFPT